jgi:hypothetical protein
MIWLLLAFTLIICAGAWQMDRMARNRRNEHGFPASRKYYRRSPFK